MSGASCLCGAVAWELDGPFEFMSHCHCSRCRKTHGVAFATYVAGPADGFRLRGAEHVTRWESSPGAWRNFCARCGSVVPWDPWNGLMIVPAGNFHDDPGVRPAAHIFVASKAPWYEIHDDLPQYAEYPPGVDAAVIADRAPLDAPGAPRGSCLCGGVAYVLEGQPTLCWNCHCGRCRRARSAAHASNLFTAVDGVRFTRGEELLASYKLPDAERFTQVFCQTCGSSLPRLDRTLGMAVVPMGTLDDDPGIRPGGHIFTASKAPWYTIADALPQYAEFVQSA
jgi:hypothetical protein